MADINKQRGNSMFKHNELGTNADLSEDDIVQLSPEHTWSNSPNNPLWVDGRVDEVDSYWVYVVWRHNNIRNSYRRIDSDLIKQDK